tara:strand:- start:3232 stop:4140 length:909 start_codon:yes stop_codon:yes gene_type:complete
MRNVLVTGAGGFVGRHLTPVLENAGWNVKGVGRREIGDLELDMDWRQHLNGIDAVVHLAAKVHRLGEKGNDPAVNESYFRANCNATMNLAQQADLMGVKKFIFISTVKVLGDQNDRPFDSDAMVNPSDPYSRSKAAAEKLLLQKIKNMGTTIIRPPLVYGPYVRGNFQRLMRIVEVGLPLPLANIKNARSLLYVGNLADAICVALDAPPGIYLPSDNEAVSTETLIRTLAAALDRPTRLFPAPIVLLRIAGYVTGKADMIHRLIGSLTVDGNIPDWHPPYSFKEGIAETAAWWRTTKESENR